MKIRYAEDVGPFGLGHMVVVCRMGDVVRIWAKPVCFGWKSNVV